MRLTCLDQGGGAHETVRYRATPHRLYRHGVARTDIDYSTDLHAFERGESDQTTRIRLPEEMGEFLVLKHLEYHQEGG